MAKAAGKRAWRDIFAGAIFMAFGLAFSLTSMTYDRGTVLHMGPGYMPMVIGGILAVLGGAIVVTGLTPRESGEPTPLPWRGFACILSALVFFGVTVDGLGLAPVVVIATVLTALASRSNGLLFSLLTGLGMAVLCVLVFQYLLGIPLPAFGPWLRP